MTTKTLAIAAALAAGSAAACGGSGTGKLESRVNNAHLAPVSAAERASEAEAQREFFLAEWQLAFTKSQIKGAELDIDIAKNDLASAKLEVKNAKLELKAAEETGDQNAIAKQQQAERIAHLQVEAKTIAVERAKQNKRYLEKRLVHEERSMRMREASVEVARADSLKAAGIKPPNFDAKRYKGQHAERVSSAKSAKGPVDSEHKKLQEIDKQLLAAKNKVLAAEGKPAETLAPAETKPMGDLPDIAPVVPPNGEEPGTEKDSAVPADGQSTNPDAAEGTKDAPPAESSDAKQPADAGAAKPKAPAANKEDTDASKEPKS